VSDDEPMILVLANSQDIGALRVFSDLRKRKIPSRLVSTDELLLASNWSHDPTGDSLVILGSGASIAKENAAAILNRITIVDPPHMRMASEADRLYAQCEFFALILSWLTQFGARVHNKPHAASLCGQQSSALEDRLAMECAGLPIEPFSISTGGRFEFGSSGGQFAYYDSTRVDSALSGIAVERVPATFLAGQPAIVIPDEREWKRYSATVVGGQVVDRNTPAAIHPLIMEVIRSRNLSIAEVFYTVSRTGETGLCSINPIPPLDQAAARDAVIRLLLATAREHSSRL